jgi:hypothetical protein
MVRLRICKSKIKAFRFMLDFENLLNLYLNGGGLK